MADIFLSYAREDRERVVPIAQELEKLGWSVFWDKKTPPGKPWRIYLKERLDESSCVLVVWSPDSITSNWVHAEAGEADKRNILIPLLLDAVEQPFGFGHIQAADLSNWKKNSADPEFQLLIDAITDIIPLPQKTTQELASFLTILPVVAPSSKPTATPVQLAVRQQSAASKTLTIGDRYGGGKVAFLDATGEHGLIAAEADLPGEDKYNWNAAKKACSDLRENGYSDWYLPSKEELNQLYLNRSAVGGFGSGVYWSSTEGGAYSAWSQFFGNGYQYYFNYMYYEWLVRPVRAF